MANKQLIVSESVHKKVGEASALLKCSVKDYTEAALMFFLARNLNPFEYKPSDKVELAQLMGKGFDRMISFIKTQEQTILRQIVKEIIVNRKLSEIQINLFIELLADKDQQSALHQAVEDYIKSDEVQEAVKEETKAKSTI
jgi:hypothetical protein